MTPVRLARLGLLAFGAAVCGHALGLWDPTTFGSLPVLCPVRRATGLACPGCGMGRALALLAAGSLRASMRQHPFAPPLLLAAGVAALPTRVRDAIPARWRAASERLAVGGVIAVIGWWLVRVCAGF